MFGLPLNDHDLSEELSPADIQKGADIRLSAEERRRRRFSGPLYALSPELVSMLAGGWQE